ncbi:MAG: hypothetical protein ACYTAF_13905 [Planctomycetota bacterium]
MDGILMLESLSQASWSVVARTYGNAHATLTGLVVNWWVGLSPRSNWALEGSLTLPSGSGKGSSGKRKGSGSSALCDAVLCLRSEPVGAVKIEGSKHGAALGKLEKILASDREELRSLRFAILVLHTYEASGRGQNRKLPAAGTPEVLEKAAALSAKFPDKPIVLITIDKTYERLTQGVRSLNEHYWGTPDNVEGILFLGGDEMMRRPYDMTVLELEPF